MTMQRRSGEFDAMDVGGQHPFDHSKLMRGGIREHVAIRDLAMASRRMVVDYPESAWWYCLHVEPRKEFTVENMLLVSDVEALVQCEPAGVVVRRGRQWDKPRTPWMPGYVLVRCVYSAAAMMSLLRLRHVTGIVGGPVMPHRVSTRSVNEFNEMVAHLAHLAALAEAERKDDLTRRGSPLMAGERARVMLGPFAKFECVITSIGKGKNPRCKAVTRLLGNEVSFDIPLASLSKL